VSYFYIRIDVKIEVSLMSYTIMMFRSFEYADESLKHARDAIVKDRRARQNEYARKRFENARDVLKMIIEATLEVTMIVNRWNDNRDDRDINKMFQEIALDAWHAFIAAKCELKCMDEGSDHDLGYINEYELDFLLELIDSYQKKIIQVSDRWWDMRSGEIGMQVSAMISNTFYDEALEQVREDDDQSLVHEMIENHNRASEVIGDAARERALKSIEDFDATCDDLFNHMKNNNEKLLKSIGDIIDQLDSFIQ
jgi:hypothetical protein